MKQSPNVNEDPLSTLVWDKYLGVVPDNIKNRMFTTAKSIFIHNLFTTLLTAYKKNNPRHPEERNGINVPMAEYDRLFPSKNSFSYVYAKLREFGVVCRFRRDIENKTVWLYVDCYVKDLERLKNLKKSNQKGK